MSTARIRTWPLVASLLALLLVLSTVASGAAPGDEVTPEVTQEIVSQELVDEVAQKEASGDSVQAMIVLEARADLQGIAGDRAAVIEELQQTAAESQEEIKVQIEEMVADLGDLRVINEFWINNSLLVEFTAEQATLNALSTLQGVDHITTNFEVSAIDPVESEGPSTADEGPYTWGLLEIGVDQIRDQLGITGQGIRVATLDTGVDITHPDLEGKMVTVDPSDPTYPGGWMEFNGSGNLVESNPHDSAYHGTHVSGTIQGGNTSGQAIGVAPDADLMHGLVIPGGSGTFAQVAAGMQWAIAPTDSDGNPAGEPADVVNMSLGAPGFYEEMITPTINMRAAGTFPAFAIGNEDLFGNCGPGTDIGSSSPGNVYEAVGVGATDIDDNVAGFSCGEVVEKDNWTDPPAHWPESYVTPDLSAPGVDVWSSEPGGGYRYLSGTSMATPHTAGTVALILSAAPEMTVDQVETVLKDTAVWNDRYAPSPPDTRYGEGIIDAYAAVSQVAIDNGIVGTVTNATTGDPIQGATVALTGTDRSVVTGEDGTYQIRVEPGTYDLEVSRFGYDTASVTGVVVTEETFTEENVGLNPGPMGSIVGTVSFQETGEGVPGALVNVEGVPVNLSDVTAADGTYAIANVPVGTYTVSVDRDGFSNPPQQTVTVTEGATSQLDFELTPPPQDVAAIGTYSGDFAEYLAPYGIEVDTFSWSEIDEVTSYSTIITSYGSSSDTTQEEWDAFTAATDANGTGIVFTDQAFGSGQGIRKLSMFTGQPTFVDDTTGTGDISFYEVTQTHPILEGWEVGDQITFQDESSGTTSRWIAWFGDYTGEGRQILGLMGRDGEIFGNGIAVQERPTGNRYALLSSHGTSATYDPNDDWTPDAGTIFLNALEWVTPEREPGQPFFTVYDLQVDPDVVKAGEDVNISADVKNVGGGEGSYEASLVINGTVEDTATVTLAPGESQEVSWTVTRDELGTYEVQVATESASFRIRPPFVDLQAHLLGSAEPLAGASVELIDQGERVPVGETDAAGTLRFEIPAPSGTYGLVVWHSEAADGDAYLLAEEITVTDDDSVTLEPTIAANPGQVRNVLQDPHPAARVALSPEQVNQDHSAATYLRPALAAPHGYLYQPGHVVASVGDYEYLHVHQVLRQERDWVLPSAIGSANWSDPLETSLEFGGEAELSVNGIEYAAGDVTVDWDLTDAYGNSFATALATDLRPFADLPDVAELENVVGILQGDAPNPGEIVMRLIKAGDGQVRAGGIGWEDRPFTFTMEDPQKGRYQIRIEAETGFYSGDLVATGGFNVR